MTYDSAPIIQVHLGTFAPNPITLNDLFYKTPDDTILKLARDLAQRTFSNCGPKMSGHRFGVMVARCPTDQEYYALVTWQEQPKSLDDCYRRLGVSKHDFERIGQFFEIPTPTATVPLPQIANQWIHRIPEAQQRRPNRNFLRGAFLRAMQSPTVRALKLIRELQWDWISGCEIWLGQAPNGDVRWHGTSYPPEAVTLPICRAMFASQTPARMITTSLQPRVLQKNDDYVVFHKPAGLLSVPGKRCEDLVHKYQDATGERLYTVHRLDLDTSGLIVFAYNEESQKRLYQQFQQGLVQKEYSALLIGDIRRDHPTSGSIRLPIGMNHLDRPRHFVSDDGRRALTEYEFVRIHDHPRFGPLTEVRFHPITGRTHQLRLHAAVGLGAPILGDPLYSSWRCVAPRLFLHAQAIHLEATTYTPATTYHDPMDWRSLLRATI